MTDPTQGPVGPSAAIVPTGAPPEPAAAPAPVRIPKILHIVWVGPHLPPMEMIDSWALKHTGNQGWLFQFWRDPTQDDRKKQPWMNQDQMNARASRREWNGVADLMRYEILFKYGGFAVDADSTCVRALDAGPIDFINSQTAVACYEHEHLRPGVIGCGFLGAPKEHPFFKACVEDAAGQAPSEMAWKTVGPLLMGRVAQRMSQNIKVYPARMFNPIHHSGTAAPGTAPIYAEQGWGSTKGYNGLRRTACPCPECSRPFFRAPWM
jgi:mannosyltransferase OCH1-like enzyme